MAYDNVSSLSLSGLQVNAAAAGPALVCGRMKEKTKQNANICSDLCFLT